MKGAIVGLGSGQYGSGGIPLTITNLFTFPSGDTDKEVESVTDSNITFQYSNQYLTKWVNVESNNVVLELTTGFFKSNLLEGSNTGTTDLSITAATGVTILVAEGYDSKIVPNGSFGVKFIANNVGLLVGALRLL